MPTSSLVIAQADGLHARPAAQFVKLAGGFKSAIKVRSKGKEANGKSILAVLALGASTGAEVELEVEGEDAPLALQQLSAFLRGGDVT